MVRLFLVFSIFVLGIMETGCAHPPNIKVPDNAPSLVTNSFGEFSLSSLYVWKNSMPMIGDDRSEQRPAIAKCTFLIKDPLFTGKALIEGYVVCKGSASPIPITLKSEVKKWDGGITKGTTQSIELIARDIALPPNTSSVQIALRVVIERQKSFWLVSSFTPVNSVY